MMRGKYILYPWENNTKLEHYVQGDITIPHMINLEGDLYRNTGYLYDNEKALFEATFVQEPSVLNLAKKDVK